VAWLLATGPCTLEMLAHRDTRGSVDLQLHSVREAPAHPEADGFILGGAHVALDMVGRSTSALPVSNRHASAHVDVPW